MFDLYIHERPNKINISEVVIRLSANKIKWIRSLQEKKFRDQSERFVIEGEKLINEAVVNHIELIEILVQTEQSNLLTSINIPEKFLCSSSELKRISSLKNPQGCLAVLKKPTPTYPPLSGQLILALDGIQDPGNLGTILRVADWFGIKFIVCSEDTVDCYNPKVIQASMGAVLRVSTFYTDLESWLKEVNIPVYGAFLSGANIYNESLTDNAVVLMGNEGKGIREKLESYITHRISIPSFGGSESLNVSIAAGIIASEFRRRHQSKS